MDELLAVKTKLCLKISCAVLLYVLLALKNVPVTPQPSEGRLDTSTADALQPSKMPYSPVHGPRAEEEHVVVVRDHTVHQVCSIQPRALRLCFLGGNDVRDAEKLRTGAAGCGCDERL